MQVTIDQEFRQLIPPLTEEERKGLEDSLLKEGCRDALVCWGNVLVDGHNRYEICRRHNLPFQTVQRDFADRNAAVEWIILNQFGRRNLPIHERARLGLRLKSVVAEKAKEQQRQSGGDKKSEEYRESVSQNSAKPIIPIDTRSEIAKVAGVSHDTIAKVEHIEKEAPAPIVEASRKGAISVNAAYQVTKLEPEKQEEIAKRIENIREEPKETSTPKAIIQEVMKRPHVTNNSGCNEWYTPAQYIDLAREVLGGIDLDPASCEFANETVKAQLFYSQDNDGLCQKWCGRVWMNPPYSAELVQKFTEKFVDEYKVGNITEGIVLVNNATETAWFVNMANAASAVVFPRGRIRYQSPTRESNAPLQGQAFIYFGDNAKRFLSVFSSIGWGAVIHA